MTYSSESKRTIRLELSENLLLAEGTHARQGSVVANRSKGVLMPFWDNRPGFAVGLWMSGGFTPSSASPNISDCLRRYTKLDCNYLASYHGPTTTLFEIHQVWSLPVDLDCLLATQAVSASAGRLWLNIDFHFKTRRCMIGPLRILRRFRVGGKIPLSLLSAMLLIRKIDCVHHSSSSIKNVRIHFCSFLVFLITDMIKK